MTFAWPHLLWLILLPTGWLVWELTRHRRASAAAHPKILTAEAGAHSLRLSTLPAAASPASSRTRPWLCLGLAFAIVALARPQWGRLDEPVFDQSREILIAIDLSRSMLSTDVKPSRLERAKLLTQSLLEKLTGERVGLVVFSGTAFLQSPLSSDYEILREFLPALNPAFLPEGGTNYRALIDTSLAAFGSTASADRFLIILSDGGATDDHWRERIPELKKKGIRVIGLGIGTAAGSMIPDGSGGLVKDERGAVVLSKLESGTLRELADATDGVYQDASNWIDLAGLIDATVDAGKKGQFLEKNTIRLVERFQWPLGLAIWCLLVSFYYEFPVRPRPRDLKLAAAPDAQTARKSAPAAAASVLLLLGSVLAGSFLLLPSPARAAPLPSTPPPAAPTPPPLAEIVGRLAAADRRTGRDWAELAQETVSWGSRLQSGEHAQPVPEGPVRDALAAVDLGSKLDPKTADWPKLREQLEALLKKPENRQPDKKDRQKQPDQPQKQDKKNQEPSKQNQQKQDQQKQDSSQKPDQPSPSDQQKPDQSKPDESKGQPSKPGDAQNKNSAFGDMRDHPPPPPKPQDMQKVGGAPEKKDGEQPPTDPSLALPLQKLDQLREQDSPAELFQLLDKDHKTTPKQPAKNW